MQLFHNYPQVDNLYPMLVLAELGIWLTVMN